MASDDRDTLLVGFDSLVGFDAPLAAAHLEAAGVPFGVRGVNVEFPVALNPDATVTRFATLLDRDPAVATVADGTAMDGRSVRAALAETVAPRCGGERRIGFPAVLGEAEPESVRTELADRLDATVFEVPMGPPSLPGIRLESLLVDAAADAGVAITIGNPVVGHEIADGEIAAVYVDKNGGRVPYHASQFVLATGGLVGKGIDSDREGVREPVFDCHVPQPAGRYDWFDAAPFGEHPFARFGVNIDDGCRPLSAAGNPEFANLRAAGGVIGGYDFAAEKSGGGVSLATGSVAGRRAAEVV